MRYRTVSITAAACILAGGHVDVATAEPVLPVARSAEPVVLTGAQLPTWSRLPAEGTALPWPSGALDGVRDAHHGTLVVPPDARTGAPVEDIVAFRWDGESWGEIPVQVDERFPYFLANAHSDFAMYSATDRELTYAWDTESWKKTAGGCFAEYPAGGGAMEDPVPTLDDDDEIVFMASDAGLQAPLDEPGPPGTTDVDRQQVALLDPLDPGRVRFVYLFQRAGGSAFDASNGYVRYRRDADADEYVDRYSWPPGHPENLGTSNTGYGPNLPGTVCRTATGPGYPEVPDGTPRSSTDRFPRDGVTVETDAYRWRASGRWMVRSLQVAAPGSPGEYGPDLIDRWKGRAFQSSPDSTISVVGFEDEQVNWEANSALIGELAGPVRAIRETWGADSGTNVTKTEIFYRDAIAYRYRLRVHPIPPDGLYTSWDYNAGVAVKYFNELHPDGVDIDGVNDDQGNIDQLAGRPAFFDIVDPTFSPASAILTWEQVSGAGDAGSLVYTIEPKGPATFENPAVVPYYRDDACFDDGTGDDPVPRPWPGEASTDARVRQGYEAANGGTPYAELRCDQRQGAWGAHGIHFFFTNDTDNAFTPAPVTELDAQQWQFAVPTGSPSAVGEPYADIIRVPLRAVAAPLPNPEPPEEPEREPTSLDFSIPPRRTWNGSQSNITAHLAEAATGDPIAGRSLEFLHNGEPIGTAITDPEGRASVRTPPDMEAGDVIRVVFEGDPQYEPSEAEGTYQPKTGASG